MAKTVYLVTFNCEDEDGCSKIGVEDVSEYFESAEEATIQLSQFLGQTDESYIDDKGFVHEIYSGVDQVFGKYFDDVEPETVAKLAEDCLAVGISDADIEAIKNAIAKLG